MNTTTSAVLRRAVAGLALTPPTAHAEAPGTAASLTQLGLGLAVVVVCIFAALALLKRLSAPRGAAAGLLSIVGATAVGPRERVVVVEVADQWLVLGVAPGQVRTLHTLPRGELPRVPATPAAQDFGARLRQALQGSPGAR